MAEGCSPLQQEDARIYPGNNLTNLGRRPLSDSTIKYEENAFHDSPEVKLVHFGERRNSFSTQGSSDGEYGDTSDDGSKPSTSSRSITSTREPERSVRVRWRKGTPTAFDCDCLQSKKSKRKAAKKFTSLWTTTGLTFPVLPDNDEIKTRHRKKDLTFMNRVKKWFCDSGSPTSCESNEASFSNTPGIASKSGKSTEAELSTSRSGKKDIQRKERHYIIGDILAVTNCSYYWGSINRHEAEELLVGKPDGTFLLRDSAHKDHLFSVSFRRYSKTLHARIEQWDHKYSFDHESPVAYFSITIDGLLSHYSIGEYCMFFEPMLVKPLIRTQPQPLMSLCRGVIGNCTRYEDVEKLPIPSSLITYLREYNYCIKPKSKKDDDGKRKRNSTLCI